jgi:hypothetical protein
MHACMTSVWQQNLPIRTPDPVQDIIMFANWSIRRAMMLMLLP